MSDHLKPIISIEKLKSLSKKAKMNILEMTTLASSGHPGGSMSSIDLLLALYFSININPEQPLSKGRDRVIISNGHISPAVYSALAMRGFFDLEDTKLQFRLAGSPFEGHVEPSVPGVEWATGNLGQGLSVACGFALECRLKSISNQIYCIMGDGEQQKGQLSEAAKFAKKYKLNNITAIIDYNKLQICGKLTDIMPQNIKANYESDGWGVLQINGHDYEEIFDAFKKAQMIDAPALIIAKTIMGHGVSFMEHREKYHGAALNDEELYRALKELGDPLTEHEHENNMVMYREKRNSIKKQRAFAKFDLKPEIYSFNFKTNNGKVYDKPIDNRTAWGDALADIVRLNLDEPSLKSKQDLDQKIDKTTGFRLPNISVFDCDLMGSVKTTDFNKLLPENFFQAGIMEHHTAVCAGAMSKYGIQTFFADFGMFGLTEVYNQHRLNDINKSNLKVILTHVGLDVGEDGNTHQCIDYIGLINNMFNFKLVIPADANQTYKAINYIANQTGNWLVAMGRSKLDIIKDENGEIFFDKDYVFEYGKIDVLRNGNMGTLYTTGTLTGSAVNVVKELSEEGIHLRLVNISSPLSIDTAELKNAEKTGAIFTLEDHNVKSGLGAIISQLIAKERIDCPIVKFGVSHYACSGSSCDVYESMGLDVKSIKEKIKNILN